MTKPLPDPRAVFVVHGRNDNARRAMFTFLRSLDLNPLEWSALITATGKPNPYIGEVLAKGFEIAQAAVVLATPDDEARLKVEFWQPDDDACETEFTGQPRQNVLFEAGMALTSHEDRTVIVELGRLRPMSDALGRHTIKMDNSFAKRQELANRLKSAGCAVQRDRTDWHKEGDFGAAVAAEAVPEKSAGAPEAKNPPTAEGDTKSSRPTAADFVSLGEHLWYLSNPPRAPVNNIIKAIRGFLNKLDSCGMPLTREAANSLTIVDLRYELRTHLITWPSLRCLEAMMIPIRNTLEAEARGK